MKDTNIVGTKLLLYGSSWDKKAYSWPHSCGRKSGRNYWLAYKLVKTLGVRIVMKYGHKLFTR